MSSVAITLGQIASDTDIAANLRRIRECVEQARLDGSDLVLFPEYAMFEKHAVDEDFADAAEPIDGPFGREVSAMARSHGVAIVVGMVEKNPRDRRPFNSMVAFDDRGDFVGRYHKIHLYDVKAFCESRWISRPDPPESVVLDLAGIQLGLMTCNDLRFPHLGVELAGAGAQVVAVAAAWVPGAHKLDQWLVLGRARAIENHYVVAGICQCPPVSVGHSQLVNAMGAVLIELDDRERAVTVGVPLGAGT